MPGNGTIDATMMVHKRGSGEKGSLCKATKSFVSSVCCPTDSEVKSCVDIDDGSSIRNSR